MDNVVLLYYFYTVLVMLGILAVEVGLIVIFDKEEVK